MQKKTLYMETTEVPAERTASEISACLIQAGATRIETAYDAGKITGLRWMMRVAGRDLLFQMPARVAPVYKILYKRRRPGFFSNKDQASLQDKAERVAWRQLLRWVQAQIAMIDAGMSEASEVFFPYMTAAESGKTIYSLFAEQQFKMLGPPEEKPQ